MFHHDPGRLAHPRAGGKVIVQHLKFYRQTGPKSTAARMAKPSERRAKEKSKAKSGESRSVNRHLGMLLTSRRRKLFRNWLVGWSTALVGLRNETSNARTSGHPHLRFGKKRFPISRTIFEELPG
jgi:hypothetical protein